MTGESFIDDRVVSHGERALELERAKVATRISDLASTSALFLQTIANIREVDPTLAPVRAQVGEFAALVARLGTKPEPSAAYRRLVPFLTWEEAVHSGEGLDEIAARLPELLGAIDAEKFEQSALLEMATNLRRVSAELEKMARQVLQKATVAPSGA
jgi:hypothetical protein